MEVVVVVHTEKKAESQVLKISGIETSYGVQNNEIGWDSSGVSDQLVINCWHAIRYFLQLSLRQGSLVDHHPTNPSFVRIKTPW